MRKIINHAQETLQIKPRRSKRSKEAQSVGPVRVPRPAAQVALHSNSLPILSRNRPTSLTKPSHASFSFPPFHLLLQAGPFQVHRSPSPIIFSQQLISCEPECPPLLFFASLLMGGSFFFLFLTHSACSLAHLYTSFLWLKKTRMTG